MAAPLRMPLVNIPEPRLFCHRVLTLVFSPLPQRNIKMCSFVELPCHLHSKLQKVEMHNFCLMFGLTACGR